jgi:hypothetical protein
VPEHLIRKQPAHVVAQLHNQPPAAAAVPLHSCWLAGCRLLLLLLLLLLLKSGASPSCP